MNISEFCNNYDLDNPMGSETSGVLLGYTVFPIKRDGQEIQLVTLSKDLTLKLNKLSLEYREEFVYALFLETKSHIEKTGRPFFLRKDNTSDGYLCSHFGSKEGKEILHVSTR